MDNTEKIITINKNANRGWPAHVPCNIHVNIINN
jgi:hypothetical protein